MNVINMVVIITCFDRKDILTCLVFTGCLVFVKGEIKKKQPQVRMFSVSFLIRTPGKGSDKTEAGNFTAMPDQVTQIWLDLNQVKNCFVLKRIANSMAQFKKKLSTLSSHNDHRIFMPSCDHQMLKCERYLDLTRAVQCFFGGELRITHADIKPFLAFFLICTPGKGDIRLKWWIT